MGFCASRSDDETGTTIRDGYITSTVWRVSVSRIVGFF
jgi:hypothetical protein